VRAPQHPNTRPLARARRRALPAAVGLGATLALATACRGSVAHLVGTTDGSPAPADQLFAAFAHRFTDVHRDAKVAAAREKLAHGALIPSRVFDDTTVWSTIVSPDARAFAYRGGAVNGQYRMLAMPSGAPPPRPAAPGDTRHLITLTKLAAEEYRWDVATDFSLGASGPANVADIFGALFSSAERRSEREIRADYRAAFPRTAAVLGMLFSVDSVRTTQHSDGSTSLDLTIDIHADGLRAKYPLFATYLKKYASPAVMRGVVRDRGSPERSTPAAVWFIADARKDRIRFQLRSRNGRLLPLTGPARTMPDTLELESLVSARIGIFRVGFEKLRSEFIISREAREPAWTLHFRREPEWKLPLFTESLIRSSLRRPFQKGGAYFRVSLRDEGGQTLLARRGQIVVQEGTILRFLGRLGSRAYSDLSTRVEKELQNYLRDVFNAMRADARALGG
jgi:hypothetical protein